MKQLNSVILEGTITGTPEFNQYVGIRALRFVIAHEHNKLVYNFDCVSYGKMAEIFAEKFKEDREVRVVGYLSVEKSNINDNKVSKVVLIAEHIELKPMNQE